MADIISDTINAACRMLGINKPVVTVAGCQQEMFRQSQNYGIQQNSLGVPFNADSSTSVNRNIMGPAHGSMIYDSSFRFNTDRSTAIKRTPNLIGDYHNRVVNGVSFN